MNNVIVKSNPDDERNTGSPFVVVVAIFPTKRIIMVILASSDEHKRLI